MKFQFIDPVNDFSNGLSVIKTYHQCLLEQGEKLLLLAWDIKRYEMTESLANRSIEMHCFYFHASRLHHLDEEEGLFPFLHNRSEFYSAMMDLLVQDHEEIEYDWQVLASMLGSPEHIKDKDKFQQCAIKFEQQQRKHLKREEEDFLPKIQLLLSLDEQQQAGKRMAELRVSKNK